MKILASDFDETIYYLDNEEQNKKNINSIKKFISRGNIFCIVTGRNYCDLKAIISKYNIPYSYLICEDGAKLFDYVDNCISTTLLDEKTVDRIIPILEEIKCDYYLDDGYNKTENKKDCVKIVVNCKDEKEKEKIVNIIKEKIDIHIYASRTHVNIINKNINKEVGIKTLFNLENLDYNLLSTIGDNDNDYQMLKAFNGVLIKKHNKILDELKLKEYETLSEYIEELI